MALNHETAGSEKPESIGEKINGFVRKNRKGIAVSFGIAVAAVAVFAAVYGISGRIKEKAWSVVEDFDRRYEELKSLPDTSGTDSEGASKKAGMETLRQELSGFAEKNSAFPAARAYSLIAAIYRDEKNWPEAESAWANAAEASGKTYFAPVSYFNAALAAEEQGKEAEAIAYYERVLESRETFPSAARAQFAIGRIRENIGEDAAALENYRLVVSRWPGDAFWTKLAQSRILVLEGRQD